jgi:hypothetical protein
MAVRFILQSQWGGCFDSGIVSDFPMDLVVHMIGALDTSIVD